MRNASKACWSTDPQAICLFSIAAGSSAVWTPENSPIWSEGVHFPNLQGHRREGASREPLSCQRGKAIQPESSLWLLISSQVTVLPRPFFFHANEKASNTARKYLSYGYHVIRDAFNMGTFTAKDFLVVVKRTLGPRWRRSSPRASLYPRPPSSQQLCMFTGTYHIDPQLRD